jgi:dTDP-4-dehydrorhamnose 3,5-epimerase
MVVRLIPTKRFSDERGWFSETYNAAVFETFGVRDIFQQDNHSLSVKKYVLRGLHYQRPPHAQAKLVRCLRGRIFDVAVDLRAGSPTYGQWVGSELTAENGKQLFIPIGFAHGFLTLEDNTEVIYKVSDFYDPGSEGGLLWDDRDLTIAWPLEGATPSLSPKDRSLARLREIQPPFAYDGEPLSLIEV